jgi:hypothetical protein
MRNVSDKSFRENQNTYFKFSNFVPKNYSVFEIMREIYCRVGQVRDENITRSMRFVRRITKATYTHST